jgi:hypothetical protein
MDSKPNSSQGRFPQESIQQFNAPNAKYNIPQEFLQESPSVNQPYLSSIPKENTKPVGVPTVDAIKNSKLPDEIKRLMLEHPIEQPNGFSNVGLSDDLIEKASRLMKDNSNNYIPDSAKPKQVQTQPTPSVGNIDYNVIQKMITEAVNNALKENGLLMESSEKSNELFTFKVGKHVFEGKVTKIKKMS